MTQKKKERRNDLARLLWNLVDPAKSKKTLPSTKIMKKGKNRLYGRDDIGREREREGAQPART
jgi:hypothetical protein